jgi:ribosomal protein S18 acetylase RimI-like enzyme
LLTYKLAEPAQYDAFFAIVRCAAADYLEDTLEQMQTTWDEFAGLFRSVGEVVSVYQDDDLAGFYWIEERDKTLHLHGLFILDAYQGKGLGTQVIRRLQEQYGGRVQAIELGVHRSNEKARALYERLGFRVVQQRDDVGFFIMQLPLAGTVEPGLV